MNECPVCKKQHTDEICPVCQFPVISFPGDPVKGMQKLQPLIDGHRAKFLKEVSVAIVTYSWKDENGVIAPDKTEQLKFGSGAELYGKETWLAQSFARIPDAESLDVTFVVNVEGAEESRKLAVPNLPEAELQQIGAVIDGDMNIRLMLKNSSGKTTSKNVPLFL